MSKTSTKISDFKPMLAGSGATPDSLGSFGDGWLMEPKHDGMRAIVEVDERLPRGIRVFSRSGIGYTDHLHDAHLTVLKNAIPDGSIVDGELAAFKRFAEIEGQRVPVVNFNRTMRVMGSGPELARKKQLDGLVTFLVFDVVKWEGEIVTDLPWTERRALVEKIDLWDELLELDTPPIFVNPVFDVSRETYDAFLEAGVEGAILKRTIARYVPGQRPGGTWMKLKAEKTFDVVVTGFKDGQGKYEGWIGAVCFGAYDADGKLVEVSRCSGMTDRERKIWSDIRDAWDPEIHAEQFVIEVKANDMVGSGEFRKPRHPQYVQLRRDKEPHECSMEQFRAQD